VQFPYGAVGFLMSDRWWNKVLRWLLGSQWDHTFVVYSTLGSPRLLVANLFGVALVPASQAVESGMTVVVFSPTGWHPEQVQHALTRAYDARLIKKGILGFLLTLPGLLACRLIGKKANPQSRMSELLLEYLRGGEGAEWEYVSLHRMSPRDLFVEISLRKDFSFLISKA
jgi:hypothetical protein